MFYLWTFPDGGTQWIGLGWFRAGWDPNRRDWTDCTPMVQQNVATSGWWYAWPEIGQPQEGRREADGLVEQYRAA